MYSVSGPVHTSNNVEATGNIVEATFDFVATNGNIVERNFNLFRHCRKDEISFDIVAETGNIVAKNGNNVKATFDTVERIVQLIAFDNVASTLLLVWTGLQSAPDFIQIGSRSAE